MFNSVKHFCFFAIIRYIWITLSQIDNYLIKFKFENINTWIVDAPILLSFQIFIRSILIATCSCCTKNVWVLDPDSVLNVFFYKSASIIVWLATSSTNVTRLGVFVSFSLWIVPAFDIHDWIVFESYFMFSLNSVKDLSSWRTLASSSSLWASLCSRLMLFFNHYLILLF